MKKFQCEFCERKFSTEQGRADHREAKHSDQPGVNLSVGGFWGKDWHGECAVCGSSPLVDGTDLCGPCCFGEAETAGGNW